MTNHETLGGGGEEFDIDSTIKQLQDDVFKRLESGEIDRNRAFLDLVSISMLRPRNWHLLENIKNHTKRF